MAITKLTGFTGEAEVMGRMVRVEFEEGNGLLLVGISHEDALVALDTLAAKVLVGVNPLAAVQSHMPEARPAMKADEEKKKRPSKPATLEQAKVMPQTETVATSSVDPVPPTPTPTGVDPSPAPSSTPAPSSPAPATLSVPVTAEKPATPDNVVPLKAPEGTSPDITKAKQLKDVITILMEHHGIKSADAMVAKCEELKATVPVLSRIADIPGRVRRAMDLLSA